MIKTKIYQYILAIMIIFAPAYIIGTTHSMENSQEYQEYLAANGKFHQSLTPHGEFKNADRMFKALQNGGNNLDCQMELVKLYRTGLVGAIPIKISAPYYRTYIHVDKKKEKYWQDMVNSNKKNPDYQAIQERLKLEKEEQEIREVIEKLQLHLRG